MRAGKKVGEPIWKKRAGRGKSQSIKAKRLFIFKKCLDPKEENIGKGG